jgi:hypothetical protein
MPRLVGFNTFAALPEEQITEIRRRILAGNQGMLVGEACPRLRLGPFTGKGDAPGPAVDI